MLIDFKHLFFEYDAYTVNIEVTPPEDFEPDEETSSFLHLEEVAAIMPFDAFTIVRVYISHYEYLGHREDIGNDEPPLSISCTMASMIRTIAAYDRRAIESYRVRVNYGDDSMYCDADGNYQYEIDLSAEFFTQLPLFKHVHENVVIDKPERSTPPKPYWPYYQRRKELSRSEARFQIVSLNTEVRRLGYFKVIAELAERRGKLPVRVAPRLLEEAAIQYDIPLLSHINTKGRISSSRTSSSATHYLDAARQIGVIRTMAGAIQLTKSAKVYMSLRGQAKAHKEPPEQLQNGFAFDSLDRLFFLDSILRHDYEAFSVLMDLICAEGVQSATDVRSLYQLRLLQTLRDAMKEVSAKYTKQYREASLVVSRIEKWKKPEVYTEHVVMPRLNWLTDLGLVDLDASNGVKPTAAGSALYEHMNQWNDIDMRRVTDAAPFLDEFITYVVGTIYSSSKKPLPLVSRSEHISLFEQYLTDSFQHFKTLAPNRVTASQAMQYAQFKAWLDHGIPFGRSAILGYLEAEGASTFVYRYHPRYNDGYIQLR